MKIEILDFYPKEKNDAGYVSGDIKIRLIDLKINILGIYVCRRTNGKWLILTPSRSGIKEGQKVHFPIVAFDEEDHKALMTTLHEAVPSYVEQRLNDPANPLVFPPKPIHPTRLSSAQPKPAPATQKASNEPAKQVFRDFRDLPPRKQASRGR